MHVQVDELLDILKHLAEVRDPLEAARVAILALTALPKGLSRRIRTRRLGFGLRTGTQTLQQSCGPGPLRIPSRPRPLTPELILGKSTTLAPCGR